MEQELISGGTIDVMMWNKCFDLVEQMWICIEHRLILCGTNVLIVWIKIYLTSGTNIDITWNKTYRNAKSMNYIYIN
jgi:hypothetical protein